MYIINKSYACMLSWFRLDAEDGGSTVVALKRPMSSIGLRNGWLLDKLFEHCQESSRKCRFARLIQTWVFNLLHNCIFR